MNHLDETLNYGVTEVKVDKNATIEDLKKILQRVAYDLWFRTLKGTN